jgi:glycosyltransferase involved in cell wall biosynthesis
MPEVSVIIPTYNRARDVCSAVDSVLAQRFDDLEVIVVDDGSTDETQELLERRYGDRIVYVYQENQERCVARNTGIHHSSGTYVAFLDSDDVWLPDKLAAQMDMAGRYPEAGLLYGRVFPIDSDGRWHLREAEMVGWGEPEASRIFDRLVMVNVIPTPTVVVKRESLDRVGLFDKAFSYCEDWDLWLRIAFHYDVVFVPGAVAGARVYDDIPSRLASYGSEMSQIRILEKVFADLPEDQVHLKELKSRAIASRYVTAACRDYALHRVPEARRNLERAWSLDPGWLHDTDRFIATVVDRGFFFAGPRGTYRDVLPFVERLFANLPPEAGRYAGMRGKASARAYIVDAFRSYQAGELSDARRRILGGILRDPSWLADRGVVSMFVRSLIGRAPGRGPESGLGFHGSGIEWTGYGQRSCGIQGGAPCPQ